MTIDYKQRAGALAAWFRALPTLVHIAIVAGALLVVLWLTGALGLAWAHWQDRRTDAKLEQLQTEADAIRVDNARLEGENARLHVEVAAKDEEIKQLAAKAEEQDAAIEQTRQRYTAARAGHAPRTAKSWDELDEELRRLTEAPNE